MQVMPHLFGPRTNFFQGEDQAVGLEEAQNAFQLPVHIEILGYAPRFVVLNGVVKATELF